MALRDWHHEVTNGTMDNYSVVHKFGRNSAVGTTFVPISVGGLYKTPTVATALEVLSASTTDENPSAGAWQINYLGLDSNWEEVSGAKTLTGTTADVTVDFEVILRDV